MIAARALIGTWVWWLVAIGSLFLPCGEAHFRCSRIGVGRYPLDSRYKIASCSLLSTRVIAII
jgi:hypothetical protein